MDEPKVVEGTYKGTLYYVDLDGNEVVLAGTNRFISGSRKSLVHHVRRPGLPFPHDLFVPNQLNVFGEHAARIFITDEGEVFQYFISTDRWYYARTPLEAVFL